MGVHGAILFIGGGTVILIDAPDLAVVIVDHPPVVLVDPVDLAIVVGHRLLGGRLIGAVIRSTSRLERRVCRSGSSCCWRTHALYC